MRLAFILAVAVLVWLPVATANGQEGSLADELVKLLEAELSEDLIVEWLKTTERPLEPLSADQLIALKKAGASPELLQELLEVSRGSAAGSPLSTVAEPTPQPSRETVEPSGSGPAPVSSSDSNALATVVLKYLSRVEEPDPEWDLYVYVDGIPVSYVTAEGVQARPNRREFARSVPPGRHVIRVTQERHERRGGKWEHTTRVANEEFWFDIAPGEPARIELEFVERMMDYSDPLLFKMVQGSSIVDSGRVGGDAEFWPLLCEDVEASVPVGKKPGRQQRRQLEDCVRWETLWSETEAPSRQQVLDAMSQFDYRPLPKGS